MRTGNKYRIQGKTMAHKNLLIRSLIQELVRGEKLKTTPTKARVIKAEFDRLVTQAKKKDATSKKIVDTFFASNDFAINKFYKLVESNFGDRNSGYTHLIRTLPRKGDNAEQMFVVVVNFEEKEKKTRVQKMLERRKKTDAEKSVGGRLKKVVKRTTKSEKEK